MLLEATIANKQCSKCQPQESLAADPGYRVDQSNGGTTSKLGSRLSPKSASATFNYPWLVIQSRFPGLPADSGSAAFFFGDELLDDDRVTRDLKNYPLQAKLQTCDTMASDNTATTKIEHRDTGPVDSENPPLETRSRSSSSTETTRPPLPPRPKTDQRDEERPSTARPTVQLQSQATTALSLQDINGQKQGFNETLASSFGQTFLGRGLRAKASLSQLPGARTGEASDTASIRSFLPSVDGQEESVFGEFLGGDVTAEHHGTVDVLRLPEFPQDDCDDNFVNEFEPIGELAEDGHNEGQPGPLPTDFGSLYSEQNCFSKNGRGSENTI